MGQDTNSVIGWHVKMLQRFLESFCVSPMMITADFLYSVFWQCTAKRQYKCLVYCLLVDNTESLHQILTVYCGFLNLMRFCTCGTRWLTTHFLCMALWVIFDFEGNIMIATHRVHYRPLHNLSVFTWFNQQHMSMFLELNMISCSQHFHPFYNHAAVLTMCAPCLKTKMHAPSYSNVQVTYPYNGSKCLSIGR